MSFKGLKQIISLIALSWEQFGPRYWSNAIAWWDPRWGRCTFGPQHLNKKKRWFFLSWTRKKIYAKSFNRWKFVQNRKLWVKRDMHSGSVSHGKLNGLNVSKQDLTYVSLTIFFALTTWAVPQLTNSPTIYRLWIRSMNHWESLTLVQLFFEFES